MPLRRGSDERSERWSHKMAVKTVSLRLTMQGNTQIENITKSVVDALMGTGLFGRDRDGVRQAHHRVGDDHRR